MRKECMRYRVDKNIQHISQKFNIDREKLMKQSRYLNILEQWQEMQ